MTLVACSTNCALEAMRVHTTNVTQFIPARERLRRHGRGVARVGYCAVAAPVAVLVLLASLMSDVSLGRHLLWLAVLIVGCLAEFTLLAGLPVFLFATATFLYRRATRGRLWRMLRGLGYEWATLDDAEWLLLKMPRAAWKLPRAEDACVLPGVSSDVDGLVAYARFQRERERDARRQG